MVVSVGLQVIEGARIVVERVIGSSAVVLGDGYTDAAGVITFFLNPNYAHTFTVSKSGFTSLTKTLNPSQASYTFTLGTESSSFYYNASTEGISYSFWPPSGTIMSGRYNFTYSVYSRNDNIYNCSFNIRMLNGTLLGSGYGCNQDYPLLGNGGSASVMINVSAANTNKLIGEYFITMTNNTLVRLEGGAMWVRVPTQNRSHGLGLMDAINSLTNLPEWGGGCADGYHIADGRTWLNTSSGLNVVEEDLWCYSDSGVGTGSGDRYWNQTTDFSRIVFFFLFLAIVLAILNFYTGYDTAYPGAFMIILTAIVFLFSASNGFFGPGYFYLPGATAGSYWCQYVAGAGVIGLGAATTCRASMFIDNWILALHLLALTFIYFMTTTKRYQSG